MALSSDEMTREEATRLLDALLAEGVERVRLDVRQLVASGGGVVEQPAVRLRVTVLPVDDDSPWNDGNIEPVLKVAKTLNLRTWLHDGEFSFSRRDLQIQ